MSTAKRNPNRYNQLIESLFFRHYHDSDIEVAFTRDEFIKLAEELGIKRPDNLGDIPYSFRYRTELPSAIIEKAPPGKYWVIRSDGRSKYRFTLVNIPRILPSENLLEIKILDSTPGVIQRYSFNAEQALLAKLRYNRLIDLFTGLTCYSLQNHLRTTVKNVGQVETDEIYIGQDKRGVHYVLPIQAKGGADQIGAVQIEQDIALCAQKFPMLICRSIASQFIDRDLIALFEFELSPDGIKIAEEKHYRLVLPDQLSPDELESYRRRATA